MKTIKINFSVSLLIVFCASFFSIHIESLFAQEVSFNNGKLDVEVNEYGRIRINIVQNYIERISLLAGASEDKVFDYYQDANLKDSISVLNISKPYYEIYGRFDNSYNNLLPEIDVVLNIYSLDNQAFALLRFNIINPTDSAIILKVGLDIVTKIKGVYGFDSVKYIPDYGVVDIYKGDHIGFKLLSDSLTTLNVINWETNYHKDSSYWSWLNSNIPDTVFNSDINGPVIILSQPFVNINPGDSVIVYYAVAYGINEVELLTNIQLAETMFSNLTPVKEYVDYIPSNYNLEQNYPNPFNPITNISFQIPFREFVSLKVFSVLGEEVAEIINEELNAGSYQYIFDAAGLSSGIYFYKLTAGKFSQTMKMLLIK